jgi:hypothetical protein
MDFKSLQRRAKQLIDRRGGTDSLKADAEELRDIAKGPGSIADKAKRASDASRTRAPRAPTRRRPRSTRPPLTLPPRRQRPLSRPHRPPTCPTPRSRAVRPAPSRFRQPLRGGDGRAQASGGS